MDSGRSTRALPRVGFPIRKSPDQRMVSSFPGLIAAAHVLLRLLAPRHPPCALVLLIRKNTFYCRYGVFKVRVTADKSAPTRRLARVGRSLKTQQRASRETSAPKDAAERPVEQRRGRRRSRRVRHWTARKPSTGRTPTGVRAPVSLERR
jgi:hypothetical protein